MTRRRDGRRDVHRSITRRVTPVTGHPPSTPFYRSKNDPAVPPRRKFGEEVVRL